MTSDTFLNISETERKQLLAKHFWVSCLQGGVGMRMYKPDSQHDSSCICKGSGRQYLLQEKCWRCVGNGLSKLDWSREVYWGSCNYCGGTNQEYEGLHAPWMDWTEPQMVPQELLGRGFNFIDGYDNLLKACKAKKWQVQIETGEYNSERPGDRVLIHKIQYGLPGMRVGHTFYSEKQIGEAAIILAMLRAVFAEGEKND